jgi:hypothetical protein
MFIYIQAPYLLLKMFVKWVRTRHERALTKLVPKVEHYVSGSNTSRCVLPKNNQIALAARLPFKSLVRFSYLTRDNLNSPEIEYYTERPWAKVFHPKQTSGSTKEDGVNIKWSDEAYGCDQLDTLVALHIQKLPEGSIQLHSDGKFLRVVVQGPAKALEAYSPADLCRVLELLRVQISNARIVCRRRKSIADRSPILSWLMIVVTPIVIIGAFAEYSVRAFNISGENDLPIIVYSILAALAIGVVISWKVKSESMILKTMTFVVSWVTISTILVQGLMHMALLIPSSCAIEEWRLVSATIYNKDLPDKVYYRIELSGSLREKSSFSIKNKEEMAACYLPLHNKLPVYGEICRGIAGLVWANWFEFKDSATTNTSSCKLRP